MPVPSLTACRRSTTRYRHWALVLAAWFGFLAQPCLAAAGPGSMEHCPHHAGLMADMPCHAMSAPDCGSDGAASLEISPAPVMVQAVSLLTDDVARQPQRLASVAPRGGTGPPARIRFCSLNN